MYTYNAFDDIFELRNLVDDFFRDVPSRARGRDYPFVRLFEGAEEIELYALLPGVKPGDLNISLVEMSLIIEGEKKTDYAEQPYIRKDRNFGRFRKAVKLPYQVDGNAINASLKDGILHVVMKRSADSLPRKIEIH